MLIKKSNLEKKSNLIHFSVIYKKKTLFNSNYLKLCFILQKEFLTCITKNFRIIKQLQSIVVIKMTACSSEQTHKAFD